MHTAPFSSNTGQKGNNGLLGERHEVYIQCLGKNTPRALSLCLEKMEHLLSVLSSTPTPHAGNEPEILTLLSSTTEWTFWAPASTTLALGARFSRVKQSACDHEDVQHSCV